jgi:hypothetical protein
LGALGHHLGYVGEGQGIRVFSVHVVDDQPPCVSGFLARPIDEPALDFLKTDRQAAFELRS